MTYKEQFGKAEQLAAKAQEYLGQGDGQDTAAGPTALPGSAGRRVSTLTESVSAG